MLHFKCQIVYLIIDDSSKSDLCWLTSDILEKPELICYKLHDFEDKRWFYSNSDNIKFTDRKFFIFLMVILL